MAKHRHVRRSKRWRKRLKRREQRLLLEAQDPTTTPDRLSQLLRFPSFRVHACVYQNPNIDGTTWVRGLYSFELGCWSNPCAPWYLSSLRAGTEAVEVGAVRRAALRCYRHRREPQGIDTALARRRIATWLNDWVQHATDSYPLEFFERHHYAGFVQGVAALLRQVPLPADLHTHRTAFEHLRRWAEGLSSAPRWRGSVAVRSHVRCGINKTGGVSTVLCAHYPHYLNLGIETKQDSSAYHYLSLQELLGPWVEHREHETLWKALRHFFPDETPTGVLRRYFPLTFLPQTTERP